MNESIFHLGSSSLVLFERNPPLSMRRGSLEELKRLIQDSSLDVVVGTWSMIRSERI
jgi:hypothetical protein